MNTVTANDYDKEYLYDASGEMDRTRMLQDTGEIELSRWLERPVKIFQEQWDIATPFNEDFNPWNDFLKDPRVANRITNYYMIRGKLHLKFVINGNGFLYGRCLVAYNPLDGFDEFKNHDSGIFQDLVQTSQLPHLFLDPTTSQGGEMVLPFLWHENYLSLNRNKVIDMGRVYINTINDLKHANGAADQVTITCFAWMSDYELATPTNSDMTGLTAQSGKESEQDEANAKGFISGPATAVARTAKALSGISTIAPYAIATEKVANMTAALAKHFGYCAPVITKSPEPYKPYNFGSMALTNVPSTAQKLSVDDKQELTVDPRIAGLTGDDPLNIRSIATRESLLTKFTWETGLAPETLLWNTYVTPVLWNETTGSPTTYHIPACAMAAIPFTYWTGTMRFRFQIVCSAFHKGRMRITYDPSANTNGSQYNTNFMRIIDIAQETDFTVEVGIGKETTYYTHHEIGVSNINTIYTSSFPVPPNADVGNGYLTVQILNELTVPNSSVNNDIEVNVYVSMGDDFQVAVPSYRSLGNMGFVPQSGAEMNPNTQATLEPSKPMHDIHENIGTQEQNLSDVDKVFNGETISSFRPMLKRAVVHESLLIKSGGRYTLGVRPSVPCLRGRTTVTEHLDSLSNGINYFNTTLYHWVRYAFQGQRGGNRWRLMPRFANPSRAEYTMYANRLDREYALNFYIDDDIAQSATNRSKSEVAYNGLASVDLVASPGGPGISYDGMAYTNRSVNDAMEIEVPYYSQYRFTPGKIENLNNNNDFDCAWEFNVITNNTEDEIIDLAHCVAEDFQVYFWTGLPRVYYQLITPPPSVGA